MTRISREAPQNGHHTRRLTHAAAGCRLERLHRDSPIHSEAARDLLTGTDPGFSPGAPRPLLR